jgi:hypothetical protein
VTIYISASHRRQGELQAVVGEHTPIALTARCPVCDVASPCGPLATALRVLGTAHLLPRRRPDATRPERTGAKRIA